MCGRFVVAGATGDLVSLFDVDLPAEGLPGPSWNIAPTDPVAIILDAVPKGPDAGAEPVRRMEAAKWGLVPAWSKDPKSGPSAINARIESVVEKPTFKTAVQKRRALVPASGYYEWRTADGVKTPYFISFGEGQVMAFAGLYEWWRNPAAADDAPDKWLLTTSILTQAATGELASIHDRMPVFLSPDVADDWLDPHEGASAELLGAVSIGGIELAEEAEFYAVSPAVGNVRNNGPELIEPV
jgi:putative SOS response-associated peptidase YedK